MYSHGVADVWCLLRLRAAVIGDWDHWGSDGATGTCDMGGRGQQIGLGSCAGHRGWYGEGRLEGSVRSGEVSVVLG